MVESPSVISVGHSKCQKDDLFIWKCHRLLLFKWDSSWIRKWESFHQDQPAQRYRTEYNTGLGLCGVTCCINVLSSGKPSSQAEHALNCESLVSQHFLMYLRGLGGLMSNSLHFHASNFHSLMEWNMFQYWGAWKKKKEKKKEFPFPTAQQWFRKQ